MAARLGQLLQATLERMDVATPARALNIAASVGGGGAKHKIPVVVSLARQKPKKRESWKEYSKRIDGTLKPLQKKLRDNGIRTKKLVTANALSAVLDPASIELIRMERKFQVIELDPLLQVQTMDDALLDVEHATFQANHPQLDGTGVRVAVLDSGIDTQHPHLNVTDSVSTCGESVDIPGRHGTHVAGSIASRDAIFRGVAPGVSLLNIKVLRSDGSGQASFITNGIDQALDRKAHILSLSIGFNHLPAQFGFHGWQCNDGDCVLCVAVDNAVSMDDALVVVAAGNEHSNAESLRSFGFGGTFDTEITCPGHARQALSIGALMKTNFLPASFTSRGPTAYGTDKPDLAAPGVGIMSTVPVPRDAQGNIPPNPQRAFIFGPSSGTSMATPIVSGAAALLIQEQLDAGQAWTPADIRTRLLTDGVQALTLPQNVAGAGRLDLSSL